MRLFFKLLICVILAYALAAYIAISANPEIKFWRSVDQLRNREIAAVRLTQPRTPIIFFTGGSSCAFSIDPIIIESTCGMPAFNLGLPVSAGPKYLLHQALEKTRKGDILVVTLEPDLLTYPDDFQPSQFGFAMAASANQPSAAVGGDSFGKSLAIREYLNLARPGPSYIATWIGKTMTGKSYRYQKIDIRYHGRIETQVSDPSLPRLAAKKVTALLPAARELLEMFQTAASARGVKVFYSMPWMLTAEAAALENKAANSKILESINTILPTIDDGYQGVATDPAFFSDTPQHLTATGSTLRSLALAKPLHKFLRIP
ncbi:MAG: hypothetical protein ABI162_01530 [Luteolibacter sp.]